ncbi:aarF domain-containing protein kinase 1 isoform X2 [Rhipicephalus sanguineus]|uniref:aarF domain-containing protein kinase 1 isoform X2 n=1 Tax=Rhipicephalus sanguineus TaxID=34632 RepID=UPI0020C2E3F9|nr:aarF domain-containing protein kinase 1 isoform X2 [Rhipicephalus sanguineus]
MLRRFLQLGALAGTSGATYLALRNNQWDVSNIGIVRFGRAAATVSRIACDYKLATLGMDQDSEEYAKARSEVHQRSAERLLQLCCINGGVFIKVGQHVGALDYLLPKEYVRTLRVLHSKAPASPLHNILQVLREDLGQDPEEVFSSFSEQPIGAASLAQVHRATLRTTGETVAVKVQHPSVLGNSLVDMATMELLVNIVAKIFPEFSLMWLAEETKRNLPLELDFVNEAHNTERVRRMFSHFPWLEVPEIHWDLTARRVMTMQFCEGGQVNDKAYMEKNGISAMEVSSRLGQLYSEMIFVQGYVHCDPHPGNLLVRQGSQGPTLVLLDHGLYTGSEIKEFASQHFPLISQILGMVPRQMLLIFKTNDLLRGIETSLGTRGAARSFITMSRCCVRAVYEDQLKHCANWWSRMVVVVRACFAQSAITVYQTFLWFRTRPLVGKAAQVGRCGMSEGRASPVTVACCLATQIWA